MNVKNTVFTVLLVLLSGTLILGIIVYFYDYFTGDKEKAGSNEPSYSIVYKERFSYEIEDTWKTKSTTDGESVYVDSTSVNQMYKCTSVINDRGEVPAITFTSLKLTIADDAEIYKPLSSIKTDPNGVEYKTSCIKYSEGKRHLFSYFVFCEEKNLIVIFQGQSDTDDYVDDTFERLERMANSITFKEMPDVVTGKTFEATSTSTSLSYVIDLSEDGTYKLYEKTESSNIEYISGTYQIFRGMEAVEKVDSMTEYGLTKNEQITTMITDKFFFDQYYAIIFHVDSMVSEGKEEKYEDVTKLYIGTADQTGSSLAVFSCNDIAYEEWKLSE